MLAVLTATDMSWLIYKWNDIMRTGHKNHYIRFDITANIRLHKIKFVLRIMFYDKEADPYWTKYSSFGKELSGSSERKDFAR